MTSRLGSNLKPQMDRSTDCFDDLFRKYALAIRAHLVESGYPENRPDPQVYRDFHELPSMQKSEIVRDLEFFLGLISEARNQGVKLSRDKRFTWLGLKKLGYRAPSGLFSVIADEDIIEVYNSREIQVFRNLDFFSICSYSLEELHVYDFKKLYDRDEALKQEISRQAIERGFASPTGQPSPFKIPFHSVREAFSKKRMFLDVDFKIISPLFGPTSQIDAVLVSAKITPQD